jgi:hypothetical protein
MAVSFAAGVELAAHPCGVGRLAGACAVSPGLQLAISIDFWPDFAVFRISQSRSFPSEYILSRRTLDFVIAALVDNAIVVCVRRTNFHQL